MSVFSGPDEHALNPPETWTVERSPGSRYWRIVTRDGAVLLSGCRTKFEAQESVKHHPIRRLYDQETRWYAGESIPGWKSWAECRAERDRIAARWPR